MPVIDLNKPLREQCREYLLSQRGNHRKIMKATGLKPRWMTRMCAGELEDPGVQKVEAVLRYKLAQEAEQADQQAQ